MAKTEEKKGTQEIQKATTHALSPFEEMDRLFDQYFSHGWLHPFRMELPSHGKLEAPFKGKTPHVNMVDKEDKIEIKAELPGVDKKDLDISVTANSVTIKGSTSKEEKEEKGDYYRREISHGEYCRTLALPVEVDEEKAKATFKDGVLELSLPKVEKAKRRTIKVE